MSNCQHECRNDAKIIWKISTKDANCGVMLSFRSNYMENLITLTYFLYLIFISAREIERKRGRKRLKDIKRNVREMKINIPNKFSKISFF